VQISRPTELHLRKGARRWNRYHGTVRSDPPARNFDRKIGDTRHSRRAELDQRIDPYAGESP